MNPQTLLFGKIPFLRYALAFGTGIIASNYFSDYSLLVIFCGLLLALVIFLYWFGNSKTNFQSTSFSLVLAMYIVMVGLYYSSYYNHNRFQTELPDKALYTGFVLDKAPSTKNRFKYTFQVESYTDSIETRRITEKIVVYNADSVSNSVLNPGDKLLFQSRLHLVSSSNNPGEFNFKQHMNLNGIRYQTYLQKPPKILIEKKKTLRTNALNIRSNLLSRYQKSGIKNQEFAVLAALTLGDKSYLSNETKSSFASSGAMHVLAVSGLHVGIIYLILKTLFSFLDRNRRSRGLKVLLIILSLWFYAFITGLSPSVLRSCTMFSLIVVGENLNRRTSIYNTLAVSAFLLMLFDPNIIYQVGFQLSYLAVLSIVYFQPKIVSLIKIENKILKWFWELTAVSIAAQIGTFPIGLFYFHQFPVYFWLSNFIVIPAAAALLYLAFFFFLTQLIPFLSSLASFALIWVLKIMNYSILAIEKLPGSVIENIWITETTLILLFLLILFIAAYIGSKKPITLTISLLLTILIIVHTTFLSINNQNQKLIVFYNSYAEPLVSFIDGNNHFYYSEKDSISNFSLQLLKNCSGKYNTQTAESLKKSSENYPNIKLHNQTIYFLNSSIGLSNQKSFSKQVDLKWNFRNSTVLIADKSKFNVNFLKKGNLYPTSLTDSINTHNNSALIVVLKDKMIKK